MAAVVFFKTATGTAFEIGGRDDGRHASPHNARDVVSLLGKPFRDHWGEKEFSIILSFQGQPTQREDSP
jgi:hypothetical protein